MKNIEERKFIQYLVPFVNKLKAPIIKWNASGKINQSFLLFSKEYKISDTILALPSKLLKR